MQAIRIRRGGPNEVTTSVGKVIDTTTLVTTKDTVLDEEVAKRGCVIELPAEVLSLDKSRLIKSVYVPKFRSEQIGRMIILNDMIAAANLLLRTLEDWPKGTLSVETIQRMVDWYHGTAVRLLSGKSGVIGGNILSTRVGESGRAVLLVNGDHHPKFAGVPDRIMHRLGIKQHDLVLIGRDPSIWHGSIEVLEARSSGNDCIELHPVVFKQLGADCDGDCVYIYKLPAGDECFEEASRQLLGFTGGNAEYAVWPPYLKTKADAEPVNWATVAEETKLRSKVTGFSVTPREILEGGSRVKSLCSRTGKDVVDEVAHIARGLSRDEVIQYVLDQNATQVTMKLLLGPIGAASNRMKVIAGGDRDLLQSACVLSEWLQQKLLSSKHTVTDKKKEPYSIWDMLDLVNRRGKYLGATLVDVIDEVGKMGMPVEAVRPIITYLWITYPLTKAVAEAMEGLKDTTIKMVVNQARALNKDPSRVDALLNRVIEVCKQRGKIVTRDQIISLYWEYAKGLTVICETEYPIFEITSGSPNTEKRSILAHRIIAGDTDVDGFGRESLQMAMEE